MIITLFSLLLIIDAIIVSLITPLRPIIAVPLLMIIAAITPLLRHITPLPLLLLFHYYITLILIIIDY
jgi:hypothetical protein